MNGTDVTYMLLGILIGHPAMAQFDDGSGGQLEQLDNAFDDYAYWDWRNWDGTPNRLDESMDAWDAWGS